MLAVNVLATQALLRRRCVMWTPPFVNAGTSSSEYGLPGPPPREEETGPAELPLRGHQGSGDAPLPAGGGHHGVHAVTLGCTSIYGLWEEPGRLMPTLVSAHWRQMASARRS